jgi:hypothetical protein
VTIDFLGVPAEDQGGIRRLFDQLVAADASRDAVASLRLLDDDVVIEVQGLGRLDRAACEACLREQAAATEESRIEYPTLYVERRGGDYRVEGTYRGWVDGRLEYEGSLEMRLRRSPSGAFVIAFERMIPVLHGGDRLP